MQMTPFVFVILRPNTRQRAHQRQQHLIGVILLAPTMTRIILIILFKHNSRHQTLIAG